MTHPDTSRFARAAPLSRRNWPAARSWADIVLMAAAAVGLFVSISDWFDRASGIQKEPGTMLVIAACALILFGLAVTVMTTSRTVRGIFQGLILLGTVLTAIAAWFLMSWTLLVAMIVATLAQLARLMAAPGRF